MKVFRVLSILCAFSSGLSLGQEQARHTVELTGTRQWSRPYGEGTEGGLRFGRKNETHAFDLGFSQVHRFGITDGSLSGSAGWVKADSSPIDLPFTLGVSKGAKGFFVPKTSAQLLVYFPMEQSYTPNLNLEFRRYVESSSYGFQLGLDIESYASWIFILRAGLTISNYDRIAQNHTGASSLIKTRYRVNDLHSFEGFLAHSSESLEQTYRGSISDNPVTSYGAAFKRSWGEIFSTTVRGELLDYYQIHLQQKRLSFSLEWAW